MVKKKEQTVGVVARGTIVELAKSMLRNKITECEADIRRAKYGREPSTFKPSDAPASVQADAREATKLRVQSDRLVDRLHKRGYDIGHDGKLEEAYSVTRVRAAEASQIRASRLVAARALREQTLIALVGANGAHDAAAILRGLREKLDAI